MNINNLSRSILMTRFVGYILTMFLWGLCGVAAYASGSSDSMYTTRQGVTYKLTLAVNPSIAGSVNASDYELEVGEETNISCRAYNGFVFKSWTIEGVEVSDSPSFDYTMPDHDATIVANYIYSPENPGNPSPLEQKLKHPVSLRVMPANSGYLRPGSAFDMEEDECRTLYAYPNDGWVLTGWTINGENQAQITSPYELTMGKEALDIVAHFTYSPSSPANPEPNHYNSSTGEMIVDDFSSGHLHQAINNLVGNSDFSKISSLIVKGEMNSNDLGILYDLGGVSNLDFSRTGGLVDLPNYTFEYSSANTIILPYTLSSLGDDVFYGCDKLESLVIYAQEPPTCSSNTFSEFGNKDECTLYVPTSAIALYSNAEYWKDFNILPITKDAHTLQVNLPSEANDGRYKNNSLEILNVKSGVRMKYVISDRLNYTFNGLQKDEQYNVYIYSNGGLEIGKIENVVIPDKDIDVTFDNLKVLMPVYAKVLASDGTDVTDRVTIEWLKMLAGGSTTYIRKSSSVGDTPEGEVLICRVSLDNELGVMYNTPNDVKVIVGEDNGVCMIKLSPIRTITLSGVLVDEEASPISGGSVSVNQILNGKYSKTFTTKTDRKGLWNLSVFEAPETRLTYAAQDFINFTDTIGVFANQITSIDLGKQTLKSIDGARITYGFTYQAAGEEEQENYYSDYQNVAISVFNETQNRPQDNIALQYPTLVIVDDNVKVGDKLKLTAISKTGVFNPIEGTVTVGENLRGDVVFDIVGKGGISASFEMTENPSVIAMLYSSKGEFLKKVNYSGAKVSFFNLEDGDYTLISMGQSDLMNSLLRLSSLTEAGLTEGKDYVRNEIEVKSGKLSEVKNPEIPAFDDTPFYYTNSSTNFSVNKSSVTTGNYLTLRAAIDFKEQYKKDISNVTLVVDLPEACEIVEQSVIQGPNLLPYTLENNRLTIQLGDNYQSQTRFCVVPTNGGIFNTTASIVFDCKGKSITQPIGAAISEIMDIEISVPSVISSTSFKVRGAALSNSEVKIYEDGVLLGSGMANSTGLWNVECNLDNPFNLSTHSIYAEITTPIGISMTTEHKDVQYDINMIRPSSVVMSFWNDWYKRQYTVKWDLLNSKCDANKYDFYTTTPVTFIVDFTDNDPERVKNIVLNIFTNSNQVERLVPIFDKDKNCWSVACDFSSSSLPTNVSVDYQLVVDPVIDGDFLSSNLFKINDDKEELDNKLQEFNNTHDQLLEELGKDNPNDELIDQLEKKLISSVKINTISSDKTFSIEEIAAHLKSLSEKDDQDILNGLTNASIFNDNLSEYTNNITIKTCDGLFKEDLINSDFQIMKRTNQEDAYVYSDEVLWHYVDFASNVHITIDLTSDTSITRLLKATRACNPDEWLEKLGQASKDIYDLVSNIKGYLEDCSGRLLKLIEEEGGELELLVEERDYLKKAGTADAEYMHGLDKQIAKSSKKIKNLDAVVEWMDKTLIHQLMGSGGKIAGKAFSLSALILDGIEAVEKLNEMWHFRDDEVIPPCEEVRREVNKLWTEADGWIVKTGVFYSGKLAVDMAELFGLTAGIAALIPSGGTSATAILASIGVMAVNLASDIIFDKNRQKFMNTTRIKLNSLKKKCGKEDESDDNNNQDGSDEMDDNSGTDPNTYSDPADPMTDPINPILDPSGYVYEAVPENRVVGVQASIYYKETKEDMYGDPYEEIVLWDAEEYAQKNPLFTDENGMYQWDVPKGLWQVKFEKDGYETAHSEWLPVPPPQLDVNIGIVQNKQPDVISAHAYESGVEIQFDKYMDLSTLTTDNVFVTANGDKLSGEICFMNSAFADEYASEEDAEAIRYASRIRFIPEESLSNNIGEVRLTVSGRVLSYAGIPMAETYSQVLDVEKEVQAIYADDMKVLYGGEKEVTIYALPYEAAVGRKLHVTTSSDLIVSIDTDEVVIDKEGKAFVKVKGELPGRAQLTFTIDDVATIGECAVDVVTEIMTAEPPTASRASGTTVYRGTEIELYTESDDAIIYYTIDGSCPCDENGTRVVYTSPIIVNEDVKILAIAVLENREDEVSEIVEFNYALKCSDIDFQMEEGWTWISHNFETGISPSEIGEDENVVRIMNQDYEVIRDPQLGLIGTLTELIPTESYKVEAAAITARKRLSDVAWNPATTIAVNSGWNWLGYPVDQIMTVDEAFTPTDVETLDVIVGQKGFAQFDGEQWIGTLETMVPGTGYMYHSQSTKDIVYNTLAISKSTARSPKVKSNSPLVLDIHKYPSVMPVVAILNDMDGISLDTEDYQVIAFCGTECRGIAEVVKGLVMMNVYGKPNDVITFKVTDLDEETVFNNSATLTFSERVVGDIFNPYIITLDSKTGIESVGYEGTLDISVEGDRLFVNGINPHDIEFVEFFDLNGQKIAHETNISESGICIAPLETGVYIVVVKGNGEYTYHKIIIR